MKNKQAIQKLIDKSRKELNELEKRLNSNDEISIVENVTRMKLVYLKIVNTK